MFRPELFQVFLSLRLISSIAKLRRSSTLELFPSAIQMKFHLFDRKIVIIAVKLMLWYFILQVREVRIWSGVLTESDVRRNMYLQRIDLVQRALTKRNKCTLIGYWPMNRLVSGTWPWQGSLVTCTSHLEAHREKTVQLRIIFSTLP